jgi:signal transduction histidine kinase
VDTSLESGALSLVGAADTYRRRGYFDPELMLTWMRDRGRAATDAGFSALRIVGDMICIAQGSGLQPQQLAEYESRLNYLLPNEPVSALCTYDRSRFEPYVIREMIATHPVVLAEGKACSNPFFVPPDEYLAPDWPEREIDWLLKTLAGVQRAQDERRESEARYQALSRRLLELQEAERRSVARDLHDHLSQTLAAIKMRLQGMTSRRRRPRTPRAGARGAPDQARAAVDALAMIDEAIEHTRNITSALRPPVLDEFGLAAALQWYLPRQAERGGVEARLDVTGVTAIRFRPPVELACFRLVQEAVTNVLRHAQVPQLEVKVSVRNGAIEIVVRDHGVGFDVDAVRKRAAAAGSFGLLGMEERVAIAGGCLDIESAPGRGTTIRARLPLEGVQAPT